MATEQRICPPHHAHGKNATCWGNTNHKCRCDDCREGQRRRMERRRKDIAYGRYEFTRSATPVRRHVNRLRDAGWTVREIAEAAGTSVHTVNRAGLGLSGSVKAESSRRILAVNIGDKPAPTLGGQMVDATGTARRLQALVYMGYTGAALMQRIGKHPRYFHQLLKNPTVFESTRRKVDALFDELWDKPPTPRNEQDAYQIRRAKKRARDRGWVGPLAFDDIDDPNESPDVDGTRGWSDTDLIEAALNGEKPNLTPEQRREVITILNERRWPAHRIANHIGCATDTVHRIRNQLDLPVYLVNGTHYKDGTVAA